MDLSVERFTFGRGLTVATLVALVAGILAGAFLPDHGHGILHFASELLRLSGVAWVRALRMTVLPLLVGLLVMAILGTRTETGLGRLGISAIVIYVSVYIASAILAVILFPALIRLFGIARGAAATMPVVPAPSDLSASGGIPLAERVLEILPTNPFEAAVGENLLQLVVFTILFAVAARRLALPARGALLDLFSPLANAMLVAVSWLLKISPIAIFALMFGAARQTGLDIAYALLAFAAIMTIVMLVCAVSLGAAAGILGRVGASRFARAVWPALVVAVTTRSSLATLPALVQGAKDQLDLPDRVVGFGLPFSASTFKPTQLVSSSGKLLFLAWIFSIPIDPAGYLAFVGTNMLLAVTTLGVPSQGSRIAALPLYLAVGIPVEGLVMVEAVDALSDYAATVLNSTAYLAATVLLPRAAESEGGLARSGQPAS